MSERIFIIGTGGLAREILWLVREIQATGTGPEVVGFVAEAPGYPTTLAGIPVIGTDETIFYMGDRSLRFVVGIGNPVVRLRIAQAYEKQGFMPASPLVHPTALIGTNTVLQPGSMVCAGSILTTDIEVGKHALINLQCTVGHDCRLADGVTLHPGVRLSGAVHLGEATEAGTGAIVLPGLALGSHVRVGAGAVVTRPLEDGGTYVGIPARRVGE